MTTRQLLSSNSFIQYPKFLGAHIGANEALILSVFCEIDSWCELNVVGYDGWFYALQSDIHWETGLSEKQQRLAIQHLIDIDLIKSDRRGLPAKNYYFIDSDELENRLDIAYTEYRLHKSQMLPNVTSRGDEREYQDVTKSEFLLLKENKKENNIKSTGAGALAKHPRNFTKETLRDDLESGKDIDEQKKEKKKVSEYDKCYKEIDDRYTDKNINSLLHQHLDWSYHSKDPQRLRNLKVFKKRLDELDKLDNKEEVIKQSLQKQWHCFYELQISTAKTQKHELGEVYSTPLDVSKAKMAEKIAKGVKVY